MNIQELRNLIDYLHQNNRDETPVYIRLKDDAATEIVIREVSIRKDHGRKAVIFIGD